MILIKYFYKLVILLIMLNKDCCEINPNNGFKQSNAKKIFNSYYGYIAPSVPPPGNERYFIINLGPSKSLNSLFTIQIVLNDISIATISNFASDFGFDENTKIGQTVAISGLTFFTQTTIKVNESFYNGYFYISDLPTINNPYYTLTGFNLNYFEDYDAIVIKNGPYSGIYVINNIEYHDATWNLIQTGLISYSKYIPIHIYNSINN